MIKQTTVLMATPIALAASAKGIDLNDRCGDIIQGLNQTVGTIKKLTEDNIAVDLPEFTSTDTEHTDVMEATTDVIAEHIRAALNTISKKVKPILKGVENVMSSQLDPSNVSETIFGYLNISMVNIEPGFLNSPFYPKEVPATFNGIDTIRLADLLPGAYPQMNPNDLVDLIAVDVAELMPFFSNAEEIRNVYNGLFVEKDFWSFFGANAIDNGVLSIRNQSNYRFSAFRPLVIGSLILNRLVSEDDPLPGVTGVSLDNYRAGLRMTRDLFSYMLVTFRTMWEERAGAGVVIVDNEVKTKVADFGNMVGKEVLSGNLTIGYNRAVLEMFAKGDELSLSEYAVGYLYAKKRGYPIKDIITDAGPIKNAWIEYCNDVRGALVLQKSSIAKNAFIATMEGLYAKEEFKPLIEVMESDVHPTQRLLQRIQAQIDLDLFFNNIPMLDAIVRNENSLMNTHLAAVLAGALDSPIAEEILILNSNKPAASIEQQRKALSCSIDTVILKRLIKA
ncbi:putative virion structural protein [Pseudomonas phage OBP]|uniref:virion structural protein n=1 Tax=Pseudomonas phage OBP TaxID=1124849 RepID=UPI000240D601|nr:virion structural protein [Pseudomonas phage OBP]AEV89718.1 putative virion structural protein [Pseudomonas phage OBP]